MMRLATKQTGQGAEGMEKYVPERTWLKPQRFDASSRWHPSAQAQPFAGTRNRRLLPRKPKTYLNSCFSLFVF